MLTATATLNTVEYGIQGVVFAIDGLYVSSVVGAGPYTLNYSASGLVTGAHTVSATVVDSRSAKPRFQIARRCRRPMAWGRPRGQSRPNVLPSSVAFDVAGADSRSCEWRHRGYTFERLPEHARERRDGDYRVDAAVYGDVRV